MTLKLTLQIIEPYVSDPSETWCPAELVSNVSVMDSAFFDTLLRSEFPEEISEFCNLEFDDFIEIFDSVHFKPKGRYYLADSYDLYTNLAIERARATAKKYHMIYIFSDEDEKKELYRADFDLISYMEEIVNSRENDYECNIDVGSAIIRSMEKYCASASWHCDWKTEGNIKQPIMWFGLDGEKAEEGWILNLRPDPETGKDWKSFWLCEDSWEDWLNRVPDADNTFLTWMTAECGISLPALEEVLNSCPIEVNEADDYESLTQKIIDLHR